MRTMHPIGFGVLTLALALALTGCGDKQKPEAKPTAQVAATVNGDEITVHQLNHELSKLGNLDPEQSKQAAAKVLNSMVDQQLLVQKAIADKLDADPQVLQAIEASRRQILAQALIQRMTLGQAKPDDAELADYYAQHPELFAERRIYRLQEINVQVTPENVEMVKGQLQETKNLGDFINWLKAQNIPARAVQSTKTAEQLPLELLPRLHQLKDGQAMTFASPNGLNILVVASSETHPMTPEQARPTIERFLDNAKKRGAAEAELKRLKETAKIDYLGEYAAAKPVASPAEATLNASPDAGAGETGAANDPK
jgi:EpsD family peptidyl-prolyl cis-trans isomerase